MGDPISEMARLFGDWAMHGAHKPDTQAVQFDVPATSTRPRVTVTSPLPDRLDFLADDVERASDSTPTQLATPTGNAGNENWLDRVFVAAESGVPATFVRPWGTITSSSPDGRAMLSRGTLSGTTAPIPFRSAFIPTAAEDNLPGSSAGSLHEIGLTDDDDPHAPVTVNDSVIVGEDGYVVFDPLANDTDADGDELTLSDWNVTPTHGLVLREDDGRLKYTPDPDYHGTDSISYTVKGLVKETSGMITVTVNPVNDGPKAFNDA